MRRRAGRRNTFTTRANEATPTEVAAVYPLLPKRPKIYGDFLIGTDWHVPFFDAPSVDLMIATSKAHRIRQLVIGGDFLDVYGLSRFSIYRHGPTLTEEISVAARLVAVLEKHFDEIHFIPGNHDLRIAKTLHAIAQSSHGKQVLETLQRVLNKGAGIPDDYKELDLTAWQLIRFLIGNPKFKIYHYPEIELNNTWLVIHPKQASRIPPQTERGLAHRFRRSIICGHNHLMAVGFDNSATDVCANIGTMMDLKKVEWTRHQITSFPEPVNGFAMLKRDASSPNGALTAVSTFNRSHTSIKALLGRNYANSRFNLQTARH
jgi:hypothetical protein